MLTNDIAPIAGNGMDYNKEIAGKISKRPNKDEIG